MARHECASTASACSIHLVLENRRCLCARVFTWRLAETNFYLAMSMLVTNQAFLRPATEVHDVATEALVLVPGTNLAFRKTPPEADSGGPRC